MRLPESEKADPRLPLYVPVPAFTFVFHRGPFSSARMDNVNRPKRNGTEAPTERRETQKGKCSVSRKGGMRLKMLRLSA